MTSLRGRLAIGSAIALLLAWVLMSTFVYLSVARSSERRLDQQLARQEQQLARTIGGAGRSDGGRRAARLQQRQADVSLPLRIGRRELLARVVTTDGRVVTESASLDALGELELPELDSRVRIDDMDVGGESLRVRSSVVGRDRVLQVAVTRSELDATLAGLRRLLVVSALLAAVLAAVFGRALADAALRPIARLTRAARRIERTGELTERVPTDAGAAELDELSTTFNEMLAKLEELRELQRRFVADASHELRTPLTSLRGNVEFLTRPELDTPLRERVMQDVVEDVGRIDSLAGDMLALARVDAGNGVERADTDVRALLEAIAQRHARGADGHELQVDAPVGLVAHVDARLLDRALSNLVVNAVRYTPSGTRIRLTASPLAGGGVEAAVIDDGPGMAPDDAARAFDRFHRGAAGTGTDGTGLGLSIVRGIAQAHGGDAQLQTAPGRGCHVRLRLHGAPA